MIPYRNVKPIVQFFWQLYTIVNRFFWRLHYSLRQQPLPNFVNISRQTPKCHRSVCMTAICHNGPISAVPTNNELLGEKRKCAKFQADIWKTERLVHVYTTYRRTDRPYHAKYLFLLSSISIALSVHSLSVAKYLNPMNLKWWHIIDI